MWPAAAILVIGVGIGFGVGYGFKAPPTDAQPPVTSTPTPAAAAPQSREAPPPVATTGRDFTETVVPPALAPARPRADADSRTTPAPPAAPALDGRLLVRSEPAGASVIVDGREYGETPTIVHGLTHGTHRVRIVRDGYVPEDRSVTVSRNQPAPSLLVTLEPRRPAADRISQSGAQVPYAGPYTASLVVESLPPGASVYLDNKAVGRTPLTLSGVNAGEHVVRLERDGYRRWARSIRVVATERNRVTASLER